jgi:hypothetical protein
MSTGTKLLHFLVIENNDSQKDGSSPISEGHIIRHFGNIILQHAYDRSVVFFSKAVLSG